MFKKAIPLVLMSGLALTACANEEVVPNKNETPMEKVEDRTRDLTPDVNNGQTGPNMDGLDNNGMDLNENGVRNGVINEDTPREDIIIDEKVNTPNEVIIDKNIETNDR